MARQTSDRDWTRTVCQLVQYVPMIEASLLRDPDRLAALWRVTLGDPTTVFEQIANEAADALSAPISLIILVDEERQLICGGVGLPPSLAGISEVPPSWGFCPLALAMTGPLMVDDVRHRAEFGGNPVVHILDAVAYAGVPLRVRGQSLGALCVVDRAARTWTADAAETLAGVAEAGMTELERVLT